MPTVVENIKHMFNEKTDKEMEELKDKILPAEKVFVDEYKSPFTSEKPIRNSGNDATNRRSSRKVSRV